MCLYLTYEELKLVIKRTSRFDIIHSLYLTYEELKRVLEEPFL
ncbi:hypothetical protein B4168_3562 [Anoxybacillus flavithermus]|nr:hypothetical protein B4168_3562 [Anoxybacillus flavithermus]